MAGLKKSGAKKQSSRAIAMKEEKERAEREEIENAEKQKRRSAMMKSQMSIYIICIYGLVASLMSLLIFNIGIFQIIGFILGIIGIRKTKDNKKDKMFWIAVAATVIGGLSLGYWLISIGYILIHS